MYDLLKAHIADIHPEMLAELSDEQVGKLHERLHRLWGAVPRIATPVHQGQALLLYADRHRQVVEEMGRREQPHAYTDRLDATLPEKMRPAPEAKRTAKVQLWSEEGIFMLPDGLEVPADLLGLRKALAASGIHAVPRWTWCFKGEEWVGCEVESRAPWAPVLLKRDRAALRKGSALLLPLYTQRTPTTATQDTAPQAYYESIHRYFHDVWEEFGPDDELVRLHEAVEVELRALGVDEHSPLAGAEDITQPKQKMVEDPALFRPDVPIRYWRGSSEYFRYGQEGEIVERYALPWLERDGVVFIAPEYDYRDHWQVHRVAPDVVHIFGAGGNFVESYAQGPSDPEWPSAQAIEELRSFFRSLPGDSLVVHLLVLPLTREFVLVDVLWDARSVLYENYGERRMRLASLFAGIPLPFAMPSGWTVRVEPVAAVSGVSDVTAVQAALVAAARASGTLSASVFSDQFWADPRARGPVVCYQFDPGVSVKVISETMLPHPPAFDPDKCYPCSTYSPNARVCRVALEDAAGGLVPVYSKEPATVDDLELRWDGAAFQWRGVNDPSIWPKSQAKVELGRLLPALVEAPGYCGYVGGADLHVELVGAEWVLDPADGTPRLTCDRVRVYCRGERPDPAIRTVEQLNDIYGLTVPQVLPLQDASVRHGTAKWCAQGVHLEDAQGRAVGLGVHGNAVHFKASFDVGNADTVRTSTFVVGSRFEGGVELFMEECGREPERYVLRRTGTTAAQEIELAQLSVEQQAEWWRHHETLTALQAAARVREQAEWALIRTDMTPLVLKGGAVPPQGVSGLPSDWEHKVPKKHRWWQHPQEAYRKSRRDVFVAKFGTTTIFQD